ncbi:hypothetical protein DSM104299_02881 [Baekduia alba]|uniref:YceI family protein n=1 Tax=Baekduia alba TaxID=2997333 RepID=UPI0023407A1A|nr:YceI family protein [Baekduia alba]WCB94153.1 hypothetical protein DSM104299_02881 [Baekduia alba]
MSRVRPRTVVLAAVALAVLAVAGGFAFFALNGGDAPAPARVPTSVGAVAATPDGTYAIARGDDSYAGYRVDERYLGVGVRTAVGRTGLLAGSASVRRGRIVTARFAARLLGSLHSDQDGRDRALQARGLETARFPSARFALTGPVALSARPVGARGRLELHGASAPVAVRVSAARLAGGDLVLVGRAPVAFADFAIAPPSVAGLVTVRDHGTLEFRLRLAHRR